MHRTTNHKNNDEVFVNHREGTEGEELNDLYSHQKLSE
jgi:hypothetical protein